MALKNKSAAKKKWTTPSENAFAGKAEPPTERQLNSVLGPSSTLWKRLVAELKQELSLDGEEWNSSGAKYGWALRLHLNKRNIVYLGPRAGSFMAAFALGDRAVAVARKSNLPPDVLRIIGEARRYAEGTAVRIEVKCAEDLDAVKVLAKIKAEN